MNEGTSEETNKLTSKQSHDLARKKKNNRTLVEASKRNPNERTDEQPRKPRADETEAHKRANGNKQKCKIQRTR